MTKSVRWPSEIQPQPQVQRIRFQSTILTLTVSFSESVEARVISHNNFPRSLEIALNPEW